MESKHCLCKDGLQVCQHVLNIAVEAKSDVFEKFCIRYLRGWHGNIRCYPGDEYWIILKSPASEFTAYIRHDKVIRKPFHPGRQLGRYEITGIEDIVLDVSEFLPNA